MKAYKGFNKDMTCTPIGGHSFQYEEGKTYHVDEAELCKSGFHACENPLDCFSYYTPANSVYHEVELEDVTNEKSDDSKRCGKTIKIGAKLDVLGICKAHFEYTKSKTVTNEQGENYSSLSAQDRSSLSAQDRSSLAARNCSSLSAQDKSSLSAGKDSVIAAFNSIARGGMGTLIALANREWVGEKYVITDFKAAIVDGKTLKANTWYKLENGEFVECEDGEKE